MPPKKKSVPRRGGIWGRTAGSTLRGLPGVASRARFNIKLKSPKRRKPAVKARPSKASRVYGRNPRQPLT